MSENQKKEKQRRGKMTHHRMKLNKNRETFKEIAS